MDGACTMIRALALVCALLFPGLALAQSPIGPPNQILCAGAKTFSGVSAATSLVSAVTNNWVFICGWHVTNTAASGTFQFEYGTQTTNPCDTGTTAVTPVFNVTSSAPSADHVDYAQIAVPRGNQLCVVPSVTTIAGMVWFYQAP